LHEYVAGLLLVEPAGRHARPFGLVGGPLDERRKVPAGAELHEDVEGTGVAVERAVVVVYDVLVVKVLRMLTSATI
jgi:hypothetical protein